MDLQTGRARASLLRAPHPHPSEMVLMKLRPQTVALFSIPVLALTLAAALPQEKKPPMPAGDFKIDGVHSTVIFRCKHMNASWSFGRFDKIDGSFTIDAAKPEASKVDITIDASSIDTNNSHRDDDLRGPNFFDVKQFPTATFKSKSVAKKGDDVLSVTGDLMIHGVTKTVTIDMQYTGMGEMKKLKKVGFFGMLNIKRSDYGIKVAPDTLGDDVQLTLSFEGDMGGA
jgi:polyisoprenoid-binding protein YceI